MTDRDITDKHQVRPPIWHRLAKQSRYLTMRDGIKIAMDLHLPSGLGPEHKVPTILHQTRYFRSALFRPLGKILGFDRSLNVIDHTRQFFVTRGYAWIDVCVRGSGASGGYRPYAWA
ncbi:CocE/NonD family hydrolase, partial [candidate division CSSED10-310 bacterium]